MTIDICYETGKWKFFSTLPVVDGKMEAEDVKWLIQNLFKNMENFGVLNKENKLAVEYKD